MKNEDGSFTQVILFAPSDSDNLKQIPYINSKAYFRGAGGGQMPCIHKTVFKEW